MCMEKYYGKNETGCCPKFIPKALDEKTIKWENKKFIRDHIMSVFHIPLNFGTVITRAWKKVMDADAVPEQQMCLSDEKSLWGSDIYLAATKEIPDAENVTLSGTFLTKVFEGQYKDAGKWAKEMEAYVSSKKKKIRKMYYFYTSCPQCAKHYGKNYVVIFAKV
ncbi:MAG: hypothetical protein GY852_02265 [bacterium]|nr:hypothetical protein [bacterium]